MLLGGSITSRDSHGFGGMPIWASGVAWGAEVLLGRVACPDAGQIEVGNATTICSMQSKSKVP